MENLGARIKTSSKKLSDQGQRLLTSTRETGKELVSFVQTGAKGWGDYLKEQYKHLEGEGRELLRTEHPMDRIRLRLDDLIVRVTRREEKEKAAQAAGKEEKAEAPAEQSGGPQSSSGEEGSSSPPSPAA